MVLMGFLVHINRYAHLYYPETNERQEYERFKSIKNNLYQYKITNIREMYEQWFQENRIELSKWISERQGTMYRFKNSFYFTDKDTYLLFILTFSGVDDARTP
jgi:hypothetical protein